MERERELEIVASKITVEYTNKLWVGSICERLNKMGMEGEEREIL